MSEDKSFIEDVKNESKDARDQFRRGLSNINDSRLSYLFDPLKRLQAFELALAVGIVLDVIAAVFGWWIFFWIVAANNAVVGYKYFQERRRYIRGGGEL